MKEKIQIEKITKTLGAWYYNKKSKKKKYVALSGKVLDGFKAMHQYKKDKTILTNPFLSLRRELERIVSELDLIGILSKYKNTSNYEELKHLSTWGLPEVVQRNYSKSNVKGLFDWQIDCLLSDNGKVLEGRNLIYSAPTSGGKTLVAEILILRKLAKKNGAIFFIVPFVALAEEKTNYFQEMWQSMDIGVKAFHGDDSNSLGGTELGDDVDIAVCTIERANILITQLLDNRKEHRLQMIVIDELHMLTDKQRGFLLEVIITKVKYAMSDSVQIIGMSATLPNIRDVAQWLDASLYCTTYRPVNLSTYICCNRTLYSTDQPSSSPLIDSVHNALDQKKSNPSSNSVTLKDINFLSTISTMQNEKIEVGNFISVYDELDGSTSQSIPGENELSSNNSTTQTNDDKSLQYQGNHPTIQMNDDWMQSNGIPMPSRPDDVDGLIMLCLQTLQENKSVLLFCNSKSRCEACAKLLSECIGSEALKSNCAFNNLAQHSNELTLDSSKASRKSTNFNCNTLNEINEKKRIAAGRRSLAIDLGQTVVGLCPTLRITLPYGVAYHHAGLTIEERKLLEQAYKEGFISVLCTTSTLSAGVNLPAHRVIIRTPKMGNSFISVAVFRQMCGRAGRTGLDANGEAILMIGNSSSERKLAHHLVTSDIDPLQSALHDGNGGGLEKLLLEIIGCGRLQHESDVLKFLSCTLMFVQQSLEKVTGYAKAAIQFLKSNQFVLSSSDGYLIPSAFGKATTLSGIAPKEAIHILTPLKDARKKLILKGGLHPVFLITPPITSIVPLWGDYEKMLHELFKENPEAKATVDYLGIDRGQLCTFAYKNPSPHNDSPTVLLYRRFYTTMILFSLVQEWPITRLMNLIKVTRGQIQQLQKDAATFCGMTVVFCKKLNWDLLASCLEDFSSRLSFGARSDIVPLLRIGTEVTNARARILVKNGIATAQDVVNAGVSVLTEILISTVPYYGLDPIKIRMNQSNDVNTSSIEMGTELINTANDEVRNSCERLSKNIMTRAAILIKLESNTYKR